MNSHFLKISPCLVSLLLLLSFHLKAQDVKSKIHSHNDYEGAVPFFKAYDLGATMIEADVFWREGALMVAHDAKDIRPERTLKRLYLDPIDSVFKNSQVGKGTFRPFILLIDIKSGAEETLEQLCRDLNAYGALFTENHVQVIVSGNRPLISKFKNYPANIFFDGRLGEHYPEEVRHRVPLISADANKYLAKRGFLEPRDAECLQNLATEVHQQGRMIRFWGMPDDAESWKLQQGIGADFIGTDVVEGLVAFLE